MAQAEPVFDVQLRKGENWGFNFKKPQDNANARGFLLVAVIPGGSLGQYNAMQAVEGRWDRIVLPGMRIRAINGIENPVGAMLQELKEKEEVTLRVESNKKLTRSSPSQALSVEHEDMLRDRVDKLLGHHREIIKQAATSDEEWKAMSSKLSEGLVKELSDIAVLRQGNQQGNHMEGSERPSSMPALTYSAGELGPTYPGDMDDEVLSEESV